MSSDESDLTPESIKLDALGIVNNLLPEKSKEKYLKAYDDFHKWKTAKGAKSVSESVLLVYFEYLSCTKKSSSLCLLALLARAHVCSEFRAARCTALASSTALFISILMLLAPLTRSRVHRAPNCKPCCTRLGCSTLHCIVSSERSSSHNWCLPADCCRDYHCRTPATPRQPEHSSGITVDLEDAITVPPAMLGGVA